MCYFAKLHLSVFPFTSSDVKGSSMLLLCAVVETFESHCRNLYSYFSPFCVLVAMTADAAWRRKGGLPLFTPAGEEGGETQLRLPLCSRKVVPSRSGEPCRGRLMPLQRSLPFPCPAL